MPTLHPIVALAFVAGAALLQRAPTLLPPLPTATAALLLAAATALLHRHPPKKTLPLLAAAAVTAAAAGLAYANWRADHRMSQTLPPHLIWKDITAEGIVDDFPKLTPYGTRFTFAITLITTPERLATPLRARVTHYRYPHRHQRRRAAAAALRPTPHPPARPIAAGARMRLTLRLRPPIASANPHGPDYAFTSLAANIRLQGYLRAPPHLLPQDAPSNIRHHIRRAINASDAPQEPLIAALVIGDRSQLTKAHWKTLQQTGTAHLVSVSGIHIGLIFLIAAALIGGVWRRFPALTTRLPTAPAALLLALPVALAYALLAGFAIPVQRSFFMATAATAALFMGGTGAVPAAIAAAAALVTLIDPWAPAQAGFWLSFLLTAATLAAAQTGMGALRTFFILQFMLSLAAIPLTQWFFNHASLVSPLANFIAIPIVGFLALPLALAGAALGDPWGIPINHTLWHAAGHLMDILWRLLEQLQQLPHAAWTPAAPPLWLFLLALAGTAWLLLPRGIPLRAAGLLPTIAMLMWKPSPLPAGEARLTALDAGQGTAIIIQTQNHTTIYDTGKPYAGNLIADHLQGEGIAAIDRLILSHDDSDHSGGAEALLTRIPAQKTTTHTGQSPCRTGDAWRRDGVQFTFLHPPAPPPPGKNDNDSSCVLLVQTARGARALLTGDISKRTENTIATPADLLIVAHHGSRHATTTEFLNTVHPKNAIITVGNNTYGHPHPDTLARLKNANTKTHRTDRHGAITAHLNQTVTITRHRDHRQRYWHELPKTPPRP